jgi:hypothetical protein
MISSANNFQYDISSTLPAGVYGGEIWPIQRHYCSSLYRLLTAFMQEGGKVIGNFDEVKTRAADYLDKIRFMCPDEGS